MTTPRMGTMTEAEYRGAQADGALGGSGVFTIDHLSPAHWRARRDQQANDAMQFGTLAHCAILEPAELHRRYATAAEVVKVAMEYVKRDEGWCAIEAGEQHAGYYSTKAAVTRDVGPWRVVGSDTPHRTRDDATAAATPDDGRLVATAADMNRAASMVEAVDNNTTACGLLSGGLPEQSMLWTEAGTDCAGQADYWRGDDRILVDLKTHGRPTPPAAAGKWIANSGYHVQLAHYSAGIAACTGAPPDEVYVVAVESVPPYAVGVYRLTPLMLRLGEYQRQRALEAYRAAVADGAWPAYPDRVVDVDPPSWAVPTDMRAWERERAAALDAAKAEAQAEIVRAERLYQAGSYRQACEALNAAQACLAEVERLS